MADEKGLFSTLKERYLNFVEALRDKGVPLPHLVVPLLVIIIIAALAFYLVPGLSLEKRDITLTVKDNLGRALPGATVELLSNNQAIETKTADASGKVTFQGASVANQLRISAEGFEPKTRSVSELSQQATVSLQSTSPPSREVSIKILDSQGLPISGAFVQIMFASGDVASQVTSDASGTALVTVQESQLSAGTIEVNYPGYERTQQAVSQEQLESGSPIVVTLSQGTGPVTDGQFTVRVTSSNAVEGARVTLIDVVTDSEKGSELTYEDGTAVFNVDFGTTFTVRVTHPQFNTVSREFTPTTDNNELLITLTSRSGPATSITLNVLDEELRPLQARVNLFDANSNTLLESGETNSVGEFAATVSTNTNAYATAYVEGYLPGFVSDLTSGSTKTLRLQPQLPGNSVQVTVVVNEDGFPASNAEVSLYRSGGFFLGIPVLTAGAQGIVNVTIPTEFNGPYRVYATSRKAAAFGQSELTDVPTTPFSLSIDLLSLPANVTISLKDFSTNQPISTGNIEALVDGLPVTSCAVSNGSCVLTVAANKQFNIEASSPGYLSYSTISQAYSAGEEAELTFSLYPLSLAQGTTVTFIGMFDSNNVKVREVANAETYTAKFAVNMPANVQNAGFYLQVGDEETVETSIATISSFDSNAAVFVQSDSKLASEKCYEGQSTPNVDDKWVYFSFPRGFVGTREFSIKVKIARDAAPGTNVNLHYKAFGFKDNLPLLAPSDTQLLETLRTKTEQGLQLSAEDTCQMRSFTQTVPVSQQTLMCNDADICWKATLSDATSRGSPSTFQPEIGRDFALELELLSPISIDSLAITTDHFTVKNPRQLSASGISFQSQEDETASSGRTFNLPFTLIANRKATLSATLTPLKVSQSAPLTITLRSGDNTIAIPLTLTISGTNTFTVTAAPPQVGTIIPSKITVVARDKIGRPVEDAVVSLFECAGSPFSGNEPSQVEGDGSLNNGQNGIYRIDVTPSGLGEIGVRVEGSDFKSYENCAVTVVARDIITIDPDVLEVTGSSLEPQAQQVTLTNLLNEPVRVSSSINCGGQPVGVKIFPTSTTIEPNSDSTVSIKPLDNVTSNAQCIAYFNARVGVFKDVAELPLSVNVNCPDCQLSVATGSASSPLPSGITLIAAPPFLQDATTIPLRLSADPTCQLEGFRINPAGMYGGYPQTYQRGVLAGVPTPSLWWCEACTQPANGKSECNLCQQVRPSAWSCGACQPRPITAPTSSQLPVHGSASCNVCQPAYGAYNSMAFMSPLAYQGHPTSFNPAVQRVGFDPTVGAPYREDYGLGYDYYSARFGASPSLPGSSYNPRFAGYNYGLGYSRESLRDALVVEECSRDAITIAADFSALGQAFPGQGNLQVTLPDGSRKTIRVNVLGAPAVASFLPFGADNWGQACGLSTFAKEVKVGPDYKFSSNVSFTLTCPVLFDQRKVEHVKTRSGENVDSACDIYTSNDEVRVNCDFSRDEKAKKALENDKELFVKVVLLSTQNPSAKVDLEIKAVFERGAATPTAKVVDVNVYRASDTSFEHSLCDQQVDPGTNVKVKYSFETGDDASKRKLLVKKYDTSWKEDNTYTSLEQSGTKDYTLAANRYSFEASTAYGSNVVTNECIVSTSQPIDTGSGTGSSSSGGSSGGTGSTGGSRGGGGASLITAIKPIYLVGSDSQGLLTSISQWKHYTIATDFDLDSNALKAKVNNRDVKATVEYQCVDENGNKQVIKQDYALPSRRSYGFSDFASVAKTSLEFVKCNLKLDAQNPYTVKVTLYDGSNAIETKYYGEGSKAVGESDAKKIYIFNYPEAPKTLPENLQTAGFDTCGRLNSPLLSEINVVKVDSSDEDVPLKSTDKLALNEELNLYACAKDASTVKPMEFKLEYTKNDGSTGLMTLEECTTTITPHGNTCDKSISTNLFLDPAKIRSLQLDVSKGVSFKARIKTDTASERYFCKYWPSQTGECTDGKVVFGLGVEDAFAYAKNKHCRILYNNPNILECDLKQGEGVELPTGMYLEVTQLDSDELSLQGYYAPDKKEKLDCDAETFGGDEMEFDADERDEVQSCIYSPPLPDEDISGKYGEVTSFIVVRYKQMVADTPYGYEKHPGNPIARVRIVAQFGASQDWLQNFYSASYSLTDANGRVIRKSKFVTPVKTLKDLGVKMSDGGEISDSREGVYIMGKYDVAKTRAGIVQFTGIEDDLLDDNFVFSVRRPDKPVIQDCEIDPVRGVIAGGLALIGGGSGFIVGSVARIAIWAGLSAVGGTLLGVGTFEGGAFEIRNRAPMLSLDDQDLEVEIGESQECSSQTMDPNIMVHGLKRMDAGKADEDGAEVCVVITTERVEEDDLESKISVDAACVK